MRMIKLQQWTGKDIELNEAHIVCLGVRGMKKLVMRDLSVKYVPDEKPDCWFLDILTSLAAVAFSICFETQEAAIAAREEIKYGPARK